MENTQNWAKLYTHTPNTEHVTLSEHNVIQVQISFNKRIESTSKAYYNRLEKEKYLMRKKIKVRKKLPFQISIHVRRKNLLGYKRTTWMFVVSTSAKIHGYRNTSFQSFTIAVGTFTMLDFRELQEWYRSNTWLHSRIRSSRAMIISTTNIKTRSVSLVSEDPS